MQSRLAVMRGAMEANKYPQTNFYVEGFPGFRCQRGFKMPWLVFFMSMAFGSGGPIPKNTVGHCLYEDLSAQVRFDFFLIQNQESYFFEKVNDNTYYVSISPDAEYLLVGVTPMDSEGQVDRRKYVVGRKFNIITRDPFFDQKGEQSLTCEQI